MIFMPSYDQACDQLRLLCSSDVKSNCLECRCQSGSCARCESRTQALLELQMHRYRHMLGRLPRGDANVYECDGGEDSRTRLK